MIEIRHAKSEDLDAVIALVHQFPDDPALREIDWNDGRRVFDDLLDTDKGSILLAWDVELDAPVGLVTLSYATALRFGGYYAMIEEFLVAASHRGRGIAGQLLNAARIEAERRQCRELQVNGPSPEGVPVFERHGFQQTGAHMKIWL